MMPVIIELNLHTIHLAMRPNILAGLNYNCFSHMTSRV